MFRERLQSALDRTEDYLKRCQYRGWDPYDGLMSPLFRMPPFRNSNRLRWAAQQVVKRVPFQVRPLLAIPKGYNPVTAALVLQAYSYRQAAAGWHERKYAAEMQALVSDLDRLRSPGYDSACWGYDFFWQSKYATNPPFHPTIVATGFVTNALYEYWSLGDDRVAAELLCEAIGFFENDLNRIDFEDSFSWSYSPSDRRAVVNATMKGARFCAQAATIADRPQLFRLAEATVKFAVANQRGDGSWPYAVNDPRSWADNFHTGYVLDCLESFAKLSGNHAYDQALARGFAYYKANFFADGVVPKYYDNRTYPIDATACAQSILTLCRFGEIALATAVAEWCLDKLALPSGAFKYQLHRHWENRLPFVRWSVAWMFVALSRLEYDLAIDDPERSSLKDRGRKAENN